tara:strand:- start:104 stop:376 length:273 start_codon:yes stop_codon:yes gene_type:complete
MEDYDLKSNSTGWLFYVKASFAIAVIAIASGVFLMEGSLLMKGYFAISALFLVSSTITLSKTLRDEHEASRLINKVSEARTSKIINDLSV